MRIASIPTMTGLLLLGSTMVGRADTAKPAAMTAEPASSVVNWLKDADTAGNNEVSDAKLALTKAQRADVRAFAQKMVDGHTVANKEIAEIATKLGVALPALKPSENALETASGADFDAVYIKEQVKDHEKAEKLFEQGTKSSDASIKAFAEKTLPAIREHLAEVRRLAGEPSKAAASK